MEMTLSTRRKKMMKADPKLGHLFQFRLYLSKYAVRDKISVYFINLPSGIWVQE